MQQFSHTMGSCHKSLSQQIGALLQQSTESDFIQFALSWHSPRMPA